MVFGVFVRETHVPLNLLTDNNIDLSTSCTLSPFDATDITVDDLPVLSTC